MIKSKPYFWVVCDGCSANAQENSDYTAWDDHGQAEDTAIQAGFVEQDGKHYCPTCAVKCAVKQEEEA